MSFGAQIDHLTCTGALAMAAVRFISLLLLIVATIAFAADLNRLVIGSSSSLWTPLASHWAEISPNSLAAAKRGVQSLHVAIWDWGVGAVLRMPAWFSFGLLGVVCGYLGRHRRRINIFTN